MSGLVWVDYLLLGIVAVSGIVGVFRGFVKEALSLGVWVVSIWCAWKFAPLASAQMAGWVEDPVMRLWAARVVVLVGCLILGGICTALIAFLLDQTGLTGTDRLLGGLFGLARGAVLGAIVVIALQFSGFDKNPWWTESKLIPYAEPIADMLREFTSEGMEMLEEEAAPVVGRQS